MVLVVMQNEPANWVGLALILAIITVVAMSLHFLR